ncbi:BTB/POZ domain-containing protein Tiwaz-like [Ruditapes philippinarum]|uniref:BTB/POZ domain-containing protein Tiwaz-like n=1 Tax=Ruditapes philippinarum TaxID=129788 RepID=UPI00295ACD64|nr:BTB/POZ domain-containing protein Tiwaz-like [Ruditapes philippinarum]XP_060575892.1 BTB/POZ domain-containing protein Tiwaz-like [Ruditapes philippinarum]XP_060575893.1 BTB/POZ domain-containing protein Tiwaz-like [Ruditapes philippinarum]
MASSEIVKLNVGGVVYTTTTSTLCKYPNSMLGAMFNGSMSTNLDENGCVFIDRDGELFKYILNYLRSSRLALPCDFKDLDQLTVEADFYQITSLIEHIEMLRLPVPEKRIRMRYLEVIEVRTGNLATMPTMNSRIKTIISGRRDIIHKYLSLHQIHPAERERLQLNTGKDFTEIALTGSNVRLQVGECLRNQGWELAESQMSTFPSGEAIAHNYKDRWSLAQIKGDQSLEESQCNGIDDETLEEISLLSNEGE